MKRKTKSDLKDAAVIGAIGLAALYILNSRNPFSEDSGRSIGNQIGYDVARTGLEAAGGVVVGAGEAVIEPWQWLAGNEKKAPGRTEPVTISTSDPRMKLDFSQTNQTVLGPSSQPVVNQIANNLSPKKKGYIFTQEEQAQFYDPFGDLQWQQYAGRKK